MRHEFFLFYCCARGLSEFASQMAVVAVGWQLYALTNSAFDLGLVGLVQFLRGRVGAVNFLFVNASYQVGGFESGLAAALLGAVPAVALGGLGTIAVALLWMRLFPTLRDLDRLE